VRNAWPTGSVVKERGDDALHRLFGEAQSGLDVGSETGVGMAPAETIAIWVKAVAAMGPVELESSERRAFAAWGSRVVR